MSLRIALTGKITKYCVYILSILIHCIGQHQHNMIASQCKSNYNIYKKSRKGGEYDIHVYYRYFWYDNLHPTYPVHQVLAKDIIAYLKKN